MTRMDSIFHMSPTAASHLVGSLSPVQRQIAELCALGHATKAVARLRNCSIKTVDCHLGRIKVKLSVDSVREIARVWFCAAVGEAS